MFKKLREFAWIIVLLLGLTFAIGGVKGAMDALDAKELAVNEVKLYNLTTPPTASIPNAQVKDSDTAKSMVDALRAQMAELTGGKSYVELPAGDPRKEPAMAAVDLQGGLT